MNLEPQTPPHRSASPWLGARLVVAFGLASLLFAGCSADGTGDAGGEQTTTTAAGGEGGPVSTTTTSPTTTSPTTTEVTTTTRPELFGVDPAAYLLEPAEFGVGWTVDPTGESDAENTSPCPGQEGTTEEIDSASAYLAAADGSATGSQGITFHRDEADARTELAEVGATRVACAGTIEIEGQTATVVITEFEPSGIGDEQLGFRFDISVGGVDYVGLEIAYRQGPLVASVALIGFDPDVDQARIEELARRAAAETGPAVGS